jgi:CheY-like chemotaxis protein
LASALDDAESAAVGRHGYAGHVVKPIRQLALYDNIRKAVDARVDAIAPTVVLSDTDRVGRRPQRILLVEDNVVNQRLALRQLDKLGFDAMAVNNGRAAVNLLEREPYDLILMDCHMPVMDGFEATAEIRKRELRTRLHVPIVAMTANARAGDRDECLAAGMDDYLCKPVTLCELERVIERRLVPVP